VPQNHLMVLGFAISELYASNTLGLGKGFSRLKQFQN